MAGESELTRQELKLRAAKQALELVRSDMVIGLGSGSTATLWIELLGEQVRDHGLRIKAVASSKKSEDLGRSFDIPFVTLDECEHLDLTIDGADEIAPDLSLIKGGGGNLLREKIVASAKERFVVIADETKVVERLGKFPLALEFIPMAAPLVRRALNRLGFETQLRLAQNGSPYVTDEGNLIFDCSGDLIADSQKLATELDGIVGLVEHGLFLNMAHLALIATKKGVIQLTTRSRLKPPAR